MPAIPSLAQEKAAVDEIGFRYSEGAVSGGTILFHCHSVLPECCMVQLQYKKFHTNCLKTECAQIVRLNIQCIISALMFGVVTPLNRRTVNQVSQVHSQTHF